MFSLDKLKAAVKAMFASAQSRAPVPSLNLMPQFAGQHYATPDRKWRREMVARFGRRQALKRIKTRRRLDKAIGDAL
jgi:hypothetical protein